MTRRAYKPVIDLRAVPTIQQALSDTDAIFRCVVGPVGSGKSFTFLASELMSIAMRQHVFPGTNIRRSRFAIVRNTTPELKSTTIKTWLEMWPEDACGPLVYSSPIVHRVGIPERDGVPGMEAEFLFLGLDRPADIAKLRSLEVTAAGFNEISEIPRAVLMMMFRRIGRFPPKRAGIEAVQPCIIADSNSTDEDHWLARDFKNPPDGWKFYKQPPAVLEVEKRGARLVCVEANDQRYAGLEFPLEEGIRAAGKLWVVNPKAENLANLRARYYHDQLPGSTLQQIQRDVQAKWVYVKDGQPVIPAYNDEVHSRDELPILDEPIEIGIDIGGGTLNPAAVIGQRHRRGSFLIHREVIGDGMGVRNFASLIKHELAELLRDAAAEGKRLEVEQAWGDPAGDKRDEVYETAVFDHLRTEGIDARAAPSQDIPARIEAVQGLCERFIDGKPALMIHRRCRLLRKALSGGWHFKRMQIAGEERFQDKPHKNHPDSDLGDALGYLLMGAGEYQALTTGKRDPERSKPASAKIEFDVFG
jgi:hypothetical protein